MVQPMESYAGNIAIPSGSVRENLMDMLKEMMRTQDDIFSRVQSLERVHVDFKRQVITEMRSLTSQKSYFVTRVDESMGKELSVAICLITLSVRLLEEVSQFLLYMQYPIPKCE